MAEMASYLVAPIKERGNPVVFFDVTISGHPAGQIRMELWKNTGCDGNPACPKTAENFRQPVEFLQSFYSARMAHHSHDLMLAY